MSELNREQIIKALENWVKNYDGNALDFTILCNALALITSQEQMIKELGEENDRLMREKKALKCVVATARTQAKADTVRKMQERFTILLKKEFDKNTPEDASFYFKNGSIMMWGIANRVFAQIAKEMLEGKL